MSIAWGPDDTSAFQPVAGGVTLADGFEAAGVVSGVKESGRPDLALVTSRGDTVAAVVTTTNRVKAPACTLAASHAADGRAHAVIVNAGNANVCTENADRDARAVTDAVASELDIEGQDVLPMSTGVIGVPLPVDKIIAALPALVADLAADGGPRAAEAMLTTDTRVKQAAVSVTDPSGRRYAVGGMAKGVGMIEPNMATMLAVITTDAGVSPATLRDALTIATNKTFNRITVDADMSTSDTVVVLANGHACPDADPGTLTAAVHAVCADLARQIVADGEGASRVAAVHVGGANNESDAEALARSVARSLLVRAAIHGADPNWGRILMALGKAGVSFDPREVTVRCAGTTVCRAGVGVPFDRAAVADAMRADEITIEIDLGGGDAHATVLTCDLSPDYVRFNAEYTT